MKDNMVLIERAKVILDPKNASNYSNAQKQMARKELSDIGTSALEATIIALKYYAAAFSLMLSCVINW